MSRSYRHEVEQLCMSLMCQYQHCLSVIPPTSQPPHIAQDSLLLATKLLSEAVARIRLFLSGLDTFNSLSPSLNH